MDARLHPLPVALHAGKQREWNRSHHPVDQHALLVKIILVWIMLPIYPSLVYGVSEDTAESHRRLGASMVHPVHLSVLAGVAFFHAFFFMRGPRKTVACFVALATLFLTYARSEELVFLIVLMVYVFTITRILCTVGVESLSFSI